MSKTIDNPMHPIFPPTPAVFSRRVASTLNNLPPRRAALPWRRLALAAAVPALAIVGVALAWHGVHPLDVVAPQSSGAPVAATSAGDGNATGVAPTQNEDVFNILLLGVDTRETKTFSNARSDTVMLLSVDTKNKTIKLTSFLRDILVDTGTGEKTRLNATMLDDGPHGVQKALQDDFGVQVDKYVVVNFWTFADIIDTLGGMDIDVQSAEITEMNRCIQEMNGLAGGKTADEITRAGKQHLNGCQTVAYLRVRHVANGDFGRVERQQAVLDQLIAKLSNLSLDQVTQIANELPQLTQSNLSPGYILDMAAKLYAVRGAHVQQMVVPVKDSYKSEKVDDMIVLTVDFDRNRQALQDFLGGAATAALQATPAPTPAATPTIAPATAPTPSAGATVSDVTAQPYTARKLSTSMPASARAVVKEEDPVLITVPQRLVNTALACQAIDGTVIQPGDTLSFNALVGRPTVEKGYALDSWGARTGKQGIGISQVSTTLYIAAARADLQIVERHADGIAKSPYAPAGQEAVADFDSGKDLVIRNTLGVPVQVSLSLLQVKNKQWTITCSLFAEIKAQRVELKSTQIETLPMPMGIAYQTSDLMEPGELNIIAGHDGYVVRTDKVYYSDNGEVVDTAPFTVDSYPTSRITVEYYTGDPQPTLTAEELQEFLSDEAPQATATR